MCWQSSIYLFIYSTMKLKKYAVRTRHIASLMVCGAAMRWSDTQTGNCGIQRRSALFRSQLCKITGASSQSSTTAPMSVELQDLWAFARREINLRLGRRRHSHTEQASTSTWADSSLCIAYINITGLWHVLSLTPLSALAAVLRRRRSTQYILTIAVL